MTRTRTVSVLAAALFTVTLAAVSAEREKAKPVATPVSEREAEGRARMPVPPPAPELKKLGSLVGSWKIEELWNEPRRFKTSDYEGWPGAEGYGTERIRLGPGDFSLVCEYEGRGPMGPVSSLLILSWDAERRNYVGYQAHNVFPGLTHLSGSWEGGRLVLKGRLPMSGRQVPFRMTFSEIAADSFLVSTETEGEKGVWKPMATLRYRRSNG